MGLFVNLPVSRDFGIIQYRISQILLYKLMKNSKYPAWRESLCKQHNIQVTPDKGTESVYMPNVTVGKTSGLGAILKCQTIRISKLSEVGLNEFCYIYSLEWIT
jgi:hypothetical protein